MKDGRPSCFIHGIGTAVPHRSLDQDATIAMLRDGCINRRSTKLLERVVRLTGIEKRHLAVLDCQVETPESKRVYRPADVQPSGPDMAQRTELFTQLSEPLVRDALAGFAPGQLARIDTLVTASCTHASSPGLEQPVFLHAAVRHDVHRWNLGFMGCSAALAASRLIHQTAAPGRQALIVACELSSLHFQYTDKFDQMTANLLFADGAAAMVLSTDPGPIRVVDCRCISLPDAADQMVWIAGNHGLRLRLDQRLPDTISVSLPEAMDRMLRENGISREAIDHWLVHPGGPQVLDSVEHSLNLPSGSLERSRSVLRRFGNMSSPTILFILREVLAARVGGRLVAMAFGPGLTIEIMLLEAT